MAILHPFVSPVADEEDSSIVGPSNWNEDHIFVEGGGATLSIGAIVDGQFLRRAGTTIDSAAAAGPTGPTRPTGPVATGPTGPTGPVATGPTGPTGPVATGPTGPTGPVATGPT